jgi:hypothetical protein
MPKDKFYSVDFLVEKMESGQYGWLDYVNHYSRKMKRELAKWCIDTGKPLSDESAEEFLAEKSAEMEDAMVNGDL